MTSEQRLCIRAELARAMDYTVIKDGTYFYLLDPHGSREENADGYAIGSTCEAGAWMNAPHPFTSAADNRALVEWMAADDARWARFYAWLVVESLGLHPGNDSPLAVVREVMTAPPETITLAAAKALGIEVEAND